MITLALALAAPAASTAPPVTVAAKATDLDSAHFAAARRLVDLVIPPGQREAMFKTVLDNLMGSMMAGIMDADPEIREAFETVPEMKPVFLKFIERQRTLALDDLRSNSPSLIDAYARAYARQFTIEELGQIEAFMKTGTGLKFIQRSTALMSDPDVLAWVRRVMSISQSRKQEELDAFQKELIPIIQTHLADKPDGS